MEFNEAKWQKWDDVNITKEISTNLFMEQKYPIHFKLGDWVLYEQVDMEDKTVCIPRLALFYTFLPCDQTIEMFFITVPRTWMDNLKYTDNPDGNYKIPISEGLFSEPLESTIIWGGVDVNILGHWRTKPKFKELLSSMRKSIYYKNK